MNNYLLPKSAEFDAIVNGRPTGLAGCNSGAMCARAPQCLRADSALRYRAEFTPTGCPSFIPCESKA